MKYKTKLTVAALCLPLIFSCEVFADTLEISGLTISKLRAVGNYSGETYDNTLEVWFTAPLVLPANIPCATARVEIDKSEQHLVSAAYMAFASGKKININIDSSLPIRGGMCQISFLDVVN